MSLSSRGGDADGGGIRGCDSLCPSREEGCHGHAVRWAQLSRAEKKLQRARTDRRLGKDRRRQLKGPQNGWERGMIKGRQSDDSDYRGDIACGAAATVRCGACHARAGATVRTELIARLGAFVLS